MRTPVHDAKRSPKHGSATHSGSSHAAAEVIRPPAPSLHLQNAAGAAALRSPAESSGVEGRFAHDFSLTPLRVGDQRPPRIYPKLAINTPGDAYERQADLIADAVMRGAPSTIAARGGSGVLRRCACGGTCAACRGEEEPEALHREASGSGTSSAFAPPIVHDVLASGGHRLDGRTRAFMESGFGVDFGGVRVHTDAMSASSARAVNAHAYTVGGHLVFAAGRYAPGTHEGDRLIAHELVHVVQQGGRTAVQRPLQVGSAADALEREAERAAVETARSGNLEGNVVSAAVFGRAKPLVQRWDSPEHVVLGDLSGGVATPRIVLEAHRRDLPQYKQDPATWPAEWKKRYVSGTHAQKDALALGLTYGEVVALSGDMYAGFAELNVAPLGDIYDLIPLIRGPATTQALEKVTAGRYLELAQKNERHFSKAAAGRSNRETWRNFHQQAIAAAQAGDANLAWGLNASADHFLTDAFSGGHVRTPRSQLMGSIQGDIESKVLHDLDNTYGVKVTNARGDAWDAYGDQHLTVPENARNVDLAKEAVRLSKQDIADALSQKQSYKPPTTFAAEALIPVPVDASKDRWTGRKAKYGLTKWGNLERVPDDYTRMRKKLIMEEGPGVVKGIGSDDDAVRAWVEKYPLAVIGAQPVDEKLRMLKVLLTDWIDDTDVAAAEKLLESVTTASEMEFLEKRLWPLAMGMNTPKQRARIMIALKRRP